VDQARRIRSATPPHELSDFTVKPLIARLARDAFYYLQFEHFFPKTSMPRCWRPCRRGLSTTSGRIAATCCRARDPGQIDPFPEYIASAAGKARVLAAVGHAVCSAP
jgi:hypothetical protein